MGRFKGFEADFHIDIYLILKINYDVFYIHY